MYITHLRPSLPAVKVSNLSPDMFLPLGIVIGALFFSRQEPCERSPALPPRLPFLSVLKLPPVRNGSQIEIEKGTSLNITCERGA